MTNADLHAIQGVHPAQEATEVLLRCPSCRHQVALQGMANAHDVRANAPDGSLRRYGQRRCPNSSCRAHVFVVFEESSGGVLAAYPPEVIDFDGTGLPENVLASLAEAISCHGAGCYRAAAIMVRRTLEDLCHDRGASGENLRDRLADLGTKVVVPNELLDGLDNLRLLGNDAAHIEAKTYDQVGRAEVELAIDVAKEVLKAVYQYRDLVARLDALKTDTSEAQ